MQNETAEQMIKRKRTYALREKVIADVCESTTMKDELAHPEVWDKLTREDGQKRIDMIYARCSEAIADDVSTNNAAWCDISYSSMMDRALMICENAMRQVS